MVPIKTEGEKVSKGDPVFRYYSNNEENLVKKIEDLDKKIQEAMSKDNSLFSSDIKLLDTQIESKLSDLYELNDIQKIKEYKNEKGYLIDTCLNAQDQYKEMIKYYLN